MWNNIVVTGNFQDTLIYNKDTVISDNNIDMYLVKYGPTGNALWAKAPVLINPSSYIYGTSVAVDDSGNFYVAGSFFDSIAFGTIKVVSNPLNINIFLAKYDSAGNVK